MRLPKNADVTLGGGFEDDDEVQDSRQGAKPSERPIMQLYCTVKMEWLSQGEKKSPGPSPAYLPPCQAKPRKGTLGTATRELRTFFFFLFSVFFQF